MTVRFGIVGCGMIAGFHAAALNEVNGATLTACTSERTEDAVAFAGQNGCASFGSLDEMLAGDVVDAVVICTPSGAHRDPAIAAARAGKHVVVEKPLEITVERCNAIIDACEQGGVRLTTIFQSRFCEAARTIKAAVDRGRFGKLSLGSACVKWFRNQQYYDRGQWRGTWDLDGGGALMNQAIHNVDLLLWTMGPVRTVTARTATLAHERIEVEDTAVAVMEFASGALGTIEATTASWPGWRKRLEICGSTGSAVLEDDRIIRWEFARPEPADASLVDAARAATETTGGASDPASISHAGHARQLQDFVDAIRDGRAPAIDGPEARRSVELITAIYRSARDGATVEL